MSKSKLFNQCLACKIKFETRQYLQNYDKKVSNNYLKNIFVQVPYNGSQNKLEEIYQKELLNLKKSNAPQAREIIETGILHNVIIVDVQFNSNIWIINMKYNQRINYLWKFQRIKLNNKMMNINDYEEWLREEEKMKLRMNQINQKMIDNKKRDDDRKAFEELRLNKRQKGSQRNLYLRGKLLK